MCKNKISPTEYIEIIEVMTISFQNFICIHKVLIK